MKMQLDDLDRQILDVLIENTRTPFTDIAKKIESSEKTKPKKEGDTTALPIAK